MGDYESISDIDDAFLENLDKGCNNPLLDEIGKTICENAADCSQKDLCSRQSLIGNQNFNLSPEGIIVKPDTSHNESTRRFFQ